MSSIPPPSPKRTMGARPLPRPPVNSSQSSSTSLSSLNPKASTLDSRTYSSQGVSKSPSPTVSHRPKLSETHASPVNDANRRGTGLNGGIRPLPLAPDASQSPLQSDGSTVSGRLLSTDNSRTYGLPSSPRPGRAPNSSVDNIFPRTLPSPNNVSSGSRPLPSSHYTIVASPTTETHSPQQSVSSQWSQSNGHTNLSRNDSARPRGAQAPAVPGHSRMFESKSKESLRSPTASTTSAEMYTSVSSDSMYAGDSTPQFRPIDSTTSYSSMASSHVLKSTPSRMELDSRVSADNEPSSSSAGPSGRLLDVHIPTTCKLWFRWIVFLQ